MRLSVIIPTYNRNDLLAKCLDNLIAPKQKPIDVFYEIVVSDDSPTNLAKSFIEQDYPFVKWVEGPKKGPAANRNNAVKFSNGDWLIFTDDDCLPTENWLASYLKMIHTNPEIAVFEGCTKADRPKERFDEESPINTTGNCLWSCNFAIKKTMFNYLNGFDESFPFAAMEDVDFYSRVKATTTILFVKEALVIHPWRRIKPFKSFQKHLQSHKHFALKYPSIKTANFRWKRFKIFIGSIIFGFKELAGFKMKGWQLYLEKCLLNFYLIFI